MWYGPSIALHLRPVPSFPRSLDNAMQIAADNEFRKREVGRGTSSDGLKWGIKISDRKKRRKIEKNRHEREEKTRRAEKSKARKKNVQHSNVNQQMSFLFVWQSINSRAFYFPILILRLSFFTIIFSTSSFSSFSLAPHLPSRYKFVNMRREKMWRKK